MDERILSLGEDIKGTEHNSNPVRFENGAWYWWDECWAFRTGPYNTRKEAERACVEYCKEFLGDKK